MRPLRAPTEGRTFDALTITLMLVVGIGLVLVVWRFLHGIGSVSGLNDGYPWGIWIAFDVVTGTALACGGYGVALLVFVFNRWKLHPLVRPAILTAALGYTIAGLSLVIDTGRPWHFWKVPVSPGSWNFDSALLEVALCIMTYTLVVWLEAAPGLLEGLSRTKRPKLYRFSLRARDWIDRALPALLGFGFLLPTLHQSSLGTLLVLTGPKVHPLWQTPLLPVLFLVSCLTMGFAAVVIESTMAHAWFGRARETRMLASLAGVTSGLLFTFVGLRLVDVVVRGQVAEIFDLRDHGALFLTEILLALIPAVLLVPRQRRTDHGHLFRMAMLIILAGGLYRFGAFLLAFDPGSGWSYFPSVSEILITLALVALEILVYMLLVRKFPFLGGIHPKPARGRSTS